MYALSFRRTLILGGLSLAVAVPLLAEDEGRPPRPRYHELINIDALIDNHVRLVARRYDLSDEQFAFTEEFLRQSADLFLERNQDVMNGLIDELFDVRAGGDMSLEELVAWGKRALPLYQDAKLMIIEGNAEWREILTDEQKAIHDEDLELMYRNIATTEEKLGRIVTGQMAVDELRGLMPSGGPPQLDRSKLKDPAPARGEPITSKTPERSGASTTSRRPSDKPADRGRGQAGGARSSGDRTSGRGATSAPTSAEFESEWEKYVREFIEKYKLDDAQSQRAWSILKSCQEQAEKYMKKRKAELERLHKKIRTLSDAGAKEKGQREELAKLKEQQGKLLEPVGRIFAERLKPRLEKLPTRAQREAAEKAPQAGSKKSERTGERLKRPKPRTPPEPPEPDDPEQEEEYEEEQGEEN